MWQCHISSYIMQCIIHGIVTTKHYSDISARVIYIYSLINEM